MSENRYNNPKNGRYLKLWFAGDLMIGRGIDQSMKWLCSDQPGICCDPKLYNEPAIKDSRDYCKLAASHSNAPWLCEPPKLPPTPPKTDGDCDYFWGSLLPGRSDNEKILYEVAYDTTKSLMPWDNFMTANSQSDALNADYRLANLECCLVDDGENGRPYPLKEVNYRCHPDNAYKFLVKSGKINVCSLANNHCMDWGGWPDARYDDQPIKLDEIMKSRGGLASTLNCFKRFNQSMNLSNQPTETSHFIHAIGAGNNIQEASRLVQLKNPRESTDNSGRFCAWVGAWCMENSGVPGPSTSSQFWNWAATSNWPGVNLLPSDYETAVSVIADQFSQQVPKPQLHDTSVIRLISLHWGSNWGYARDNWSGHLTKRRFAKQLIDRLDRLSENGNQLSFTNVIFAHSSHHPKRIEIYRNSVIMYGCGDLMNDYEGIHESDSTYAHFRPDLTFAYMIEFFENQQEENVRDALDFRIYRYPVKIRQFQMSQVDSIIEAKWLSERCPVEVIE